jgi:carboxypeptidase Q
MRSIRFLATAFVIFAMVGNIIAQEAAGQKFYSDSVVADMERLRDAALADDYAYSQTAYLTNSIGPRLSGSPQAARAVEYVAEQMRKIGLVVTLQELKVPHWVRGEEKGELTRFEGMAPGTTQKIVLTALGGSVSTGESGLTGDIVVVKDYEELNALGREKVQGKIVLYNVKFDQRLADAGEAGSAYGQVTMYRGGGASAAAKLGAKAVLVRSAGGSQNRLAHTGGLRYADGVEKIPAAAVSYEDAELIAYLAEKGAVTMHLLLTPQSLPDVTSYNVIADLKGSERPDEVVIVSGHLDSWDLGTGALDDGVGVAVAMQVPYLIKKLGLKPARTIRVVAFMNEENGFVGARTYAEKAEISKQFAAIESDLGADHPIGFVLGGSRNALPMLRPIAKVLATQGASLIDVRESAGSDISTLAEKGVPTFEPWYDSSRYFNYHHTAADTLDKVNPVWLAENGSVMAVLAYGLANLESPLPR